MSSASMTSAEREVFFARVAERLRIGETTYGDKSFERPAPELVDEIQQELEDVCGWALILWVRLNRMRAKLHGG